MTIVLIVSVSLLAILIVAVLAKRRHFLLPKQEENQFNRQLPAQAVSLFVPDAKELAQIEHAKRLREKAVERERTLAWASLIDFSSLSEVKRIADEKLRDDVLEILTERAKTNEDVLALVDFVLTHREIKVSKQLVNAFQEIWKAAPNRNSTIKMLRLAAESNDAELFLKVLHNAEQFIAFAKLNDLTASELNNLASSHYWLLGESARTSGAGFMLKQKLASWRRNS